MWSRPGHDTYGFTLSEPLAPGEWAVATSSSDEYWGRSESSQSQEQWLLDITDHVVLGPTSDLVDGTESASTTDSLGSFVSEDGVRHFTVRHAASSTPMGTNSVTADCVSFTRVAPPTTTTTTVPTTTAPPTTTTIVTTTTVVPSTTTTTSVPSTTLPPVTVPSTTLPPTTLPPIPASVTAAAVVDCAAGQVFVLLGNEGELGATVDVALPLSAITSGLVVDGGATTTSSLPIGDLEGSAEIRVTDSLTGETYLRTTIEIDCGDPSRPTASTLLDCATDVLVVVLGNDAGDPASLTVIHERVASIAQVDVLAGETLQVEVALDGAASIPIRVIDADGADVLRVDIVNACPPREPVDPTDDNDCRSIPCALHGRGRQRPDRAMLGHLRGSVARRRIRLARVDHRCCACLDRSVGRHRCRRARR